VPPAIDELERIIASAYRPGESLTVAPHLASALLTAFEITGRLPYSMLAEELMSGLRAESASVRLRTESASARQTDLVDDCEAALVFCRLAALHGNAEYRAAAVLAPGADYRADAARILRDCAPLALAAQVEDAARYGIALRELISLR